MTITVTNMPKVMNLEQVRAKVALAASQKIGSGSNGGKAVAKKIPAQIIQNGFLGALAFAIESVSDPKFQINEGFYLNTKAGKDGPYEGCGYANSFLSVMQCLKKTHKDFNTCDGGLSKFLSNLCSISADELRMVTDEALCYLNYLRRFAKTDKAGAESED